MYYRARYYKPAWSRFLSEDPIGFGGGINPYVYTDNNPLSLIDPFGLDPWWKFRIPISMDAAVAMRGVVGFADRWGIVEAAELARGRELFTQLPLSLEDIALSGKGSCKRKRGGENPSAANGRQRHAELEEKVKAKPGWQNKPRIPDPDNPGKIVEPDAITKGGRPLELKPRTPSGIRKGKSQLKTYERVLGKKGRVIYYDP
jgi:uncharacterized protein RhaS with RHS repeats